MENVIKFNTVADVERFLEVSSVKKVKLDYTDDNGKRVERYRVWSVIKPRTFVSKGFTRVYFSFKGKNNKFIQSNEYGEFDKKIFIEEVTNILKNEQTYQDMELDKANVIEKKKKMAKEMNSILVGTGFSVEMSSWGDYEISRSIFSHEELERVVKIIKANFGK